MLLRNYVLTARPEVFTKAELTVTVSVGQASITDIKLQVGSTTQTVEVMIRPRLCNTDNANLSTSFGSNQIQNQPNGGNDLTNIAQTAPGVTMDTAKGGYNFTGYGLPSLPTCSR